MKTTALLSALTLAVVAIAAPAEIEARGGGGGGGGGGGSSGGTCNSDNHQRVCCNGAGLLDLACTVGILSTGCNQGTYCCDTKAAAIQRSLLKY
ncbi:hypothetical protein FOXB_05032 [Fusarium oxysporum f. sp. conglutinans Fo5176]|uniref:Hydrophobin 3 n=1 Tax=Fusarium oxysporum (strain Fo5176) TaxID=660025 RepID=F9FF53_FUSOF|nr:hypothetical protein FOXB_05032 [Fusarium oxysporum f. sp. conglutinans Fo5176]